MLTIRILIILLAVSIFGSCSSDLNGDQKILPAVRVNGNEISIDFSNEGKNLTTIHPHDSVIFEVIFPTAGRYKVQLEASSTESETSVWIEDYIDNLEGRTCDVTGKIIVNNTGSMNVQGKEGSPFNKGRHLMRIHSSKPIHIDHIEFSLIKEYQVTPVLIKQSMIGNSWSLRWSDEFEAAEIDQSKWTYDMGDWGWGNNELQYYTVEDKNNARIEDGILVIEARKENQNWTSARLTTRGKQSFLYGKIEFRAKVPSERGNWAAVWTLGDDYIDEISWPHVGVINMLESVGFEVDEETGEGLAHTTVQTTANFFKVNNQISSTQSVQDMADKFHIYSMVWTPDEIRCYIDGEQYYLYNKNANKMEWPFDRPQNLVLNLAMGGNWGGAKGMDPSLSSQKFLIDYIRVYEKINP